MRSLKKGERALLVPGPTGAEPWEVWILGEKSEAECVQICTDPRAARLRQGATFALPAAEVFCLPLWLNETDAKQFGGMIPLQMELRGLQPRGADRAVFDWSVVAQEGTRTLVIVGVLAASLPPEVEVESCADFDLSVRYLTLPEDSLTLWREQDRLIVAMTRGPKLVYYQPLAEGPISGTMLQDLNCICATLTMQQILRPLSQVMLWTELGTTEMATLQGAFRLPINQSELPAPRQPATAWKLMPVSMSEAKKDREVRGWRNRILWIVLSLYLVAVAVMAVRFALVSHQVDELRTWQTEHAQALAQIHDTEAAWKELRPVVDENNYPLESLLHASDAIPADQLHLTLFEAGDNHLLIKGEAKNVAGAFQFLDNLKQNPHLVDYTWDMGQPHLLPNDLAQFQIEGTRP